MYDLVLKNGKIIDGKRNAAFAGDLAIKDGRQTDARKGSILV